MTSSHDPSQSHSSAACRTWPILQAFAGYRASFISADLVAGLTLAAIAVPEQMATAKLAGFPPQAGFFVFIAGSIAFAIFGNNRLLSCGADSTIAPIFAGGLGALAAAGSPEYYSFAAAVALMVGGLLVAAGLFRLDRIADLLSQPVMIGFLAGIAAHITVSQLPSLLGLAAPDGSLPQKIAILAAKIAQANWVTLAIGGGVFALVSISELISARLPGALIGLAAATIAVAFFGLGAQGVAVLGTIDTAWPALQMPNVAVADLVKLGSLSFILGVIIMVQTAATTRSFPSGHNEPPDICRDFIGVGAGCGLAAAIGAFPVNASPPRTATLFETGARSQLAGLFAAALITMLLAYGGALLRNVPIAALAGVLLFVALKLVRLRQILTIFRQSFPEFMLILATAAAIIVLPIEEGAATGIVLSLLQGIWSTTRARIVLFEHVPGTSIWWPVKMRRPTEHQPGVLVLGFPAPLSFLNADHFRHDVEAALRDAPDRTRLLVIEAAGILEVDFTAAQVLRDLIEDCRTKEIDVAVARLESLRAQDALTRFGIEEALGRDHIFHSVDEAVRALVGSEAKQDS
ncbi:MAG: SulP family inorganic anion transporter [Beijerinckiaceae bacterium]